VTYLNRIVNMLTMFGYTISSIGGFVKEKPPPGSYITKEADELTL